MGTKGEKEKSVEKKSTKKKLNREKIKMYVLFAVGVVFLALALRNSLGDSSKKTTQKNHADLINTKEIAMLSVSEFVYNGIAQAKDEDGNIDYNVLYNSTVKVSIDANEIDYTVDEKQKIAKFIFPEFSIDNPVIDVSSVSLIPSRTDLVMKEIITLCRNDALEEAKKSEKLMSSARENLRSIIEAWYSPVLQGYSFEYEFGLAEGGEVK